MCYKCKCVDDQHCSALHHLCCTTWLSPHNNRERFDFRDQSISQLLEQAPLLPMPAVANFLRDLALQGAASGELGWTTRALATARAVLQARPPARQPLLAMVLQQVRVK